MLNKIWPFFITISIIFSFLFGNIEALNNSIFESTENAIKLSITLLGTMCMWCGIMKIAMNTKLIEIICKIINPIINKLFPEINKNKSIKKEISMNIIANILGLGNAATPLGLKAMDSMQKENKDKNKLSNSMMTFILLNTASLQLIPTTVLAIRNSLDSENCTKIIIPTWGATIIAAITGIIAVKILIKKTKKFLIF